jgi:hypothetical protein
MSSSAEVITGSKSASIRMMVFISSPFLDQENGPFIDYNAHGREIDDRCGEKDWSR